MTTYDLGKVTGDDGNGIVSIEKTGTSGLVDTYTITYTDGDTDTFTVTNGSDASVTIVTSWNSTTSDSKVPSEKLAKTSLDGKLDNSLSSTAVSIASNDDILITDYSDSNKIKRVANILATQVKDSNSHSNIGSSANATQGTINSNIDTALSNKANSSSLSTVATSGSYADLSNKPSIPSSSSDLSDGSSLVKTSSTSGLIKNDGSIDTNTYLSSSALDDYVQKSISISQNADLNDITATGFYYCSYNVIGTNISNTPNNIQSAFCLLVEDMGANVTTKKKQTFTTTSDGQTWVRTKTGGSWQSWKQLSTFSGSYDDLSNKPSIPSSSSDLSDGSSLVKTSNTSGLIKNDGSIDTNTYISSSSLPTKTSDLTNDGSSNSDSLVYVETSATSGLLKNDGTVDTTSYLSSLPSHNHDDRYYTESEMDTALSNKISKSGASGLVRNDGTIDASNYITSSALNGYQTTSNLVTSFSGTTSDSKYPSQKLVKNSLDGKQATLVSGTNLKTINNESLLGSGNISIGGSSVDIVTAWESTPSDSKVASEKLVKDSLDDIEDLIGEAIQYINQ